MEPRVDRSARWQEEARHFDRLATRAGDLALDPATLRRYTRPRPRSYFSPELRFGIIRPLTGRTVLDVGCGDGANSVLLARLGAHVTGVDLSGESLEVARRRAAATRVSDRVRFVESPIETADLPDDAFDVVWGDGILHHVLDDLALVLGRVVRWARPDGLVVFSEPVNLSPGLRRIRRLFPMRTDVTPGERPLVRAELDVVRRHLRHPRERYYGLLGRLDRFVLPGGNFERAPRGRRLVAAVLAIADAAVLDTLGLRRLAGTCVVYGPPHKRAATEG